MYAHIFFIFPSILNILIHFSEFNEYKKWNIKLNFQYNLLYLT